MARKPRKRAPKKAAAPLPPKRPPGRPRLTARPALLADLERYIEETEIPILAEWAAAQHVARTQLYDWEEFADAISRCVLKKEGALERQAHMGKIPVAMAIFSLKQLGWKDQIETTNTVKGDRQRPLALTTVDPAEAARAYVEMIGGRAG